MKTEDYEKLGEFYLGREYDLGTKELRDELVLYDSKDLVTHGVVLGMTGSGKTGLCLAMIEEAALDSIPAIAIDPKGDIANLLLTFPELRGEDFRPWINEDDARRKGVNPEEFATAQAALWKDGLGKWGQDGERIRQLRERVELAVYTPGSSAGIPVSILSSLNAPAPEARADAEIFAERIESTVSSLLSLLGIDADPIQDPEHILLSNIFRHCWQGGEDLGLESLVGYIQEPPFNKVGVMDMDGFFPEKKRVALAMRMNNLLASPGFAIWLEGEPLDVKRLLHTVSGRPRISIFSIAHLGDAERMFFVSLLLNQVLGWMRSQPGTTSLRALLYMDEIFGFLPPSANPPSKKPMLTMLKQARAFGLGVLLATQNPVDLDYKALSNIGTWFLGRLQTERDKMRVLDGLEGAAAGREGRFDRGRMEEVLAGLGNRIFLMNNVHEDGPVTFQVRWVMSYLRGPLTREQIRALMAGRAGAASAESTPRPANPPAAAAPASAATVVEPPAAPGAKPGLPAGVGEAFLPSAGPGVGSGITYVPAVRAQARIKFAKPSLDLFGEERVDVFAQLDAGTALAALDWSRARPVPPHAAPVPAVPHAHARFEPLPPDAAKAAALAAAKRDFADWLFATWRLRLHRSARLGEHSRIGESEGEFRVRIAQSARERRDEAKEKLRQKYAKRFATLEDQRRRAAADLEEQRADVGAAHMKTAVSIGSTLFGAIMGRRLGRRASSVIGSARSGSRQKGQVRRVEAKLADIDEKIAALNAELQAQVKAIETGLDPMTEALETVEIAPFRKDIRVENVGILWLPLAGGQGGSPG